VRFVQLFASPNFKGPLGKIYFGYVVSYQFRSKSLGLGAEQLHHLRAGKPLGKAGIILNVGRQL
jgi:hypothetical protein